MRTISKQKLWLFCSWVVLTLATLPSCVKRRDISVRNSEKSATTSGAKTAVFETRSTVLASISAEESTQFIDQIIESQSNKVFRDVSSKPPRPSKVLGGEMTTTVSATSTKLCLQGGRLEVGAESSMSVRLELDVCGFEVIIDQPRAKLEFSGALSSKPLNLSMRELRLSNSNVSKVIALTFDVGVHSNGGLSILGRAKTEGVVELLAPSQVDFDVELSETSWLEDRLRKTRQKIISEMLEGMIAASEGFVTSAIEDAVARSLVKAQEAFAKRTQTLTSRLFELKFLGYKLGLSTDILGFFGGESLGVAVQMNLQASKRFLSMPGYRCQIDEIGQMPSPIVGSLHASDLVNGSESRIVVKPANGPGVLQGRVFVPYEAIDFSLWKIFGQSGHCIWTPEPKGGVEGELRFSYNDGVRVRVVDRAEFPLERVGHLPSDAQILSIQFPNVEFRLPSSLAHRVEAESRGVIKADSLIDAKFGQIVANLRKFNYALAVRPQTGPQAIGVQFIKLSRGGQSVFKDAKVVTYEDLWKAITDEILQSRKNESGVNQDSADKTALAMSRVVGDMIDQQVFRLLGQTPIEFSEVGKDEDFAIQDLKFGKEGMLAEWRLRQKKISLTELESSSVQRNNDQVELGLAGSGFKNTSAKLAFEKLGLPFFLGQDFATVDLANQGDATFHDGLRCSGSTPVRVDSSDATHSDVRFLSCVSNTHAIEHRLQTWESKKFNRVSHENPIVYQRILIERHKDHLPSFERRELLASDLLSSFGSPDSRLLGDGFFRLTWRRDSTLVSAITFMRDASSANAPKNLELQLMRSFVQSIEIWNADPANE